MPRDVPEPIPSKFVIRKLPPELTEDAFKAILDNVCQDELEWFRYHSGSSGESGITTSTAFIKLRNPGLAPILKQLLQNSPFIGDHGVPYHCEMEVAFYQRVPKERTKEDPSVATYEQDPYYKEFLKDIQREDEAAKKGPAITATTTIVEETTETEPIITPLMSYVINRYKSSSGRARNGKGSSGDGREKENRKRMPAIPEKAAPSKSTPGDAATAGKAAPSKRGRGSKREDKSVKGKGTPAEAASASEKHQESSQTGKGGRGKGSKAQARAGTNGAGTAVASGGPSVPASTTAADGSSVAISSADVAAAKSAAQAAARVAMQLASETGGPLSGVGVGANDSGVMKNGAASAASKAGPKRPRSGRRARGRGATGGQDTDAAAADSQGQSQAGETQAGEPRLTSANERAIAAAAAAASAALQDSAPGERPRPRTRPALGARGVRDALSRAGIKQPAAAATGKQKSGSGGAAASGAPAGDGRDGSSGP